MLDEHERPERVRFESMKRIVVVNLRGRLLWVENARNAKGEVKVVFFLWEEVGDFGGCVGNGLFV